jgi:NCAIR mutase (PurE)-related protein
MTNPHRTDTSLTSPTDANGAMRRLLEDVAAGRMTAESALADLSKLPRSGESLRIEDLGFAQIDHERAHRKGFPEVVYGAGKTPEQVASIAQRVHERSGVVLVTRTNPEAFEATSRVLPSAVFEEDARIIWADSRGEKPLVNGLAVVSAGTSDLPVAREAVLTARLMGCDVQQVNDVGVAGLHRLLGKLEVLRTAKVLVVVAGMEGALPSVVAGLVSAPVIAVPTSVGYGSSFDGLAALLAMMNSCASGVSVVNIDGGFAAGYQAAMIARSIAAAGDFK